jgi:phosphatidylglycerol:prolipoprotein diacylglycerol transferase
MLQFPHIKPYIVKIWGREIRWYGLMYLIGFVSSYLLVKRQIKKRDLHISKESLESLYFSIILGLIVGARVGYVLFYNFSFYLYHPLDVIAIWHGGMSFHGGLIGVVIAVYIFSKRYKIHFLLLSDLVVPTAPIGLFCGRIGNFINGELYGRPADVPWAMVFPEGGDVARHPSQLYEALFEGIVLFSILWIVRDRVKREGTVTALFFILYGIIRFIMEFFREPDAQLGFVVGFFSMGQILSSSMILAGSGMLVWLRVRKAGEVKGTKQKHRK